MIPVSLNFVPRIFTGFVFAFQSDSLKFVRRGYRPLSKVRDPDLMRSVAIILSDSQFRRTYISVQSSPLSDDVPTDDKQARFGESCGEETEAVPFDVGRCFLL